MLPVTEEYNNAIKQQFRRKTTIESVISSINPTDVDRTSLDVSGSSPQETLSRGNQVYDQNVRMSYGWNTLERNRVNSTGNFVIFNDNTVGQYGFWGSEMCDADGVFANPQTIKLNYSENMNFLAFSLFFDYWAKEYAVDFSLYFYNGSGNIIEQFDITDNQLLNYVLEAEINFVRSMKIEIRKWSKGNRRAKVTELLGGLIIQFDESNILDFDLIENTSMFTDNIVSNEMSISVLNVDRQFDPINPLGIAEKLTKKQIFNAYLNIKGYNLALGSMYLYEWSNDGIKARFKCRTFFDFIESDYIPKNHETVNAHDLFEEMFAEIGIENFAIDDSLQSITVNRYVRDLTHRQAIQYLATACRSIVYVNRQGIVIVEPISDWLNYPKTTVDYDTIKSHPKTTQEDIIEAVTVSIYNYSLESDSVSETLVDDDFELEESQDLIVEYGKIATNVTVTTTGGTLTNKTIYADKCSLSFTVNGLTTIHVTITGTPITETVKKTTKKTEGYNTSAVKKNILIENPFICLLSNANMLGQAYIDLSLYRVKHVINERGRPEIETNDLITVQNKFGFMNGYVSQQRIKWNKTLSGQLVVMCKRDNEV